MRAKLLLWSLITKPCMGLVYVGLIGDGFRTIIPALGQKLWKLPGLASLYDFQETHRLDMAHVLAVFMLIAVWYLWERLLVLWLSRMENYDCDGWDPVAHFQLVLALGVTVLGADAALFYAAMSRVGWRGGIFSLTALIATVAYLAVVIFVTFVTVTLKHAIQVRKGRQS